MIPSRRLIPCLTALALAISCSTALGASFKEFFDSATPPTLPNGWVNDPFDQATASWHVVAVDPETPPNCVSVSVPGGVRDNSLYSPPIPIISGASSLSFKHKFAFDSNANGALAGGRLEISIDGVRGGEWLDPTDTAAGLDGDWVIGGPNMAVSSQDNPLFGRGALLWSGFMNDSYMLSSLRLPTIAGGKTIHLRWRMVSGSNAASTIGWKVDSVLLCDPSDTTSNLCPQGNCGSGTCGTSAMVPEAMLLGGMLWQRRRNRRRPGRRFVRRS